MADVVQYRLERMLDELDDLEQRGLFTRREIAEIVKKRRGFEYKLKRPSPLKQDYIFYIEYENQLDSLRHLRKKSIVRELRKKQALEDDEGGHKKKRNVWKRSVSDNAGVLRILEIYRLALSRYKGDINLWFRYLEFCRKRGHGRMKQVLAQVIRFHPKVPGLWIYAAAWEFDHNLNVAAARALMQSGLRACPDSEDLWVEYLRMELTYLNKLRARKVALGEEVRTLTHNSDDSNNRQWKEENKDLFMPLIEGGDVANEASVSEEDKYLGVGTFREQGSVVLRAIYSGAVEALPTSMSLRKRFLEILDGTDLAYSDELRKDIMDDIKKDFSREEDYWEWLARLQISDFEKGKEMGRETLVCQLNKAVEVYEEALEVLPSAKMFSLYARFWSDVLAPKTDAQNSILNSIDHDVDFNSNLLHVYETAESRGCITEDLAYQYISFYLLLEKIDEARELAKQFCDGKFSGAAKLWVLRVSIEMKCTIKNSTPLSRDELQHLFELLRHALNHVATSEAKSLWLMGIKFFANNKEYFDKLIQSYLFLMAKCGGSQMQDCLSSAIINCVFQKQGIRSAREMYKRFLACLRPSIGSYRCWIELELNLACVGDREGLANARKLYESALSTYKHEIQLWHDYYSMEVKVGTSETANAVFWRARKTLGERAGLMVPCNP